MAAPRDSAGALAVALSYRAADGAVPQPPAGREIRAAKTRPAVTLPRQRTDFGRVDFAEQSPDQRVFSAVWALEAEVNNGGFAQYFASWDGDTAGFAPDALERIGATSAAAIVRRALAAVSAEPLPDDHDAREALVNGLSDDQLRALEVLDEEFFAYPDDLTGCLFAFVSAHPEASVRCRNREGAPAQQADQPDSPTRGASPRARRSQVIRGALA
jgi:hypothetical protein